MRGFIEVITVEPAKLLEHLFDKKKVQIIKQFLSQPEREWTLVELAKAARVPNATTYRILNKLTTLELIEEKKIKHLKTYVLSETSSAKYLGKILETGDTALETFVESVKALENVTKVILHGKQTKEKANVLIIGNRVDSHSVNDLSNNIKEKFNFTIITLVLDPEQYEQMASMGLYAGTKRLLFDSTA